MKKYEFIDHTADFGVRIYGKTINDLFKNSAIALFDTLVNYKPKNKIRRAIKIQCETLEDLFVRWLNELISIFFTFKYVPAQYDLQVCDSPTAKKLKAALTGEIYDLRKNKIQTEIKAATYHNLKIKKIKKGYMAEIIFDV